MNFFEVLLIALSMAMDAFTVCLSVGAQKCTAGPRPVFRLAFHFGLFQFLMPIIGWFAGRTILHYVSTYGPWLAFGLLAFVGIRMVRSGFNLQSDQLKRDPSRGWNLVLLAFATSIDAMAVGFSLGLVVSNIWYPAVVIGVVTGLLCWIGVRLGNRLGTRFGTRMEITGGIVLVLIGIKMLL